MFSGIVEEMGAVQAIERGLAGAKFSILASAILEDLQVGESVSVSGACLTATIVEGNSFSVDVSTETMNCTFLSKMTVGTPLNLERAMKLNARIGGHLVTGHVDGVGILRAREQDGNALYLTVEAPDDVIRYCVPKGSITMDGISLTINAVKGSSFSVAIIPHTAKVTTIGLKQIGDLMNLESDLIGKYVERLLQGSGTLPSPSAPSIDKDYLQKRGLL
ncbi:MAG: riboflavin synthase [Nitrospirota bacterium]|nr:riboflavin synthase [Nitrospirota bacterium]MDH5586153.1 riboflavin synthase [Nitrospirota bacterium]